MIEDIFDFFYRHTLIADCLKTIACGVVLSFVLGFSAAGVVYAFFNPELFWVTFKITGTAVVAIAVLLCLFLCFVELFFHF